MKKISRIVLVAMIALFVTACTSESVVDELVIEDQFLEGSVGSVESGPQPPPNQSGSSSDPYDD